MERKTIQGRNKGTLHPGGPNPGAGRPRKGLKDVNHQLKEAGYQPVTNADYVESVAYLLNLDEDGMKAVIADKSMPMVMRIQAKRMLEQGKGFEAIQVLADRAHGKAVQRQEVSGADGQALSIVVQVTPPDVTLNTDP